MNQVKRVLLELGRFIGISALVALGLFALVTLSQVIWPGTREDYSNRMFWASLLAIIAGMPAVLASLSTSQGYYDNPLTAGMDMQAAHVIIKDGRQGLSKRARYAWRMFSIGGFGILIAALIDRLG